MNRIWKGASATLWSGWYTLSFPRGLYHYQSDDERESYNTQSWLYTWLMFGPRSRQWPKGSMSRVCIFPTARLGSEGRWGLCGCAIAEIINDTHVNHLAADLSHPVFTYDDRSVEHNEGVLQIRSLLPLFRLRPGIEWTPGHSCWDETLNQCWFIVGPSSPTLGQQ